MVKVCKMQVETMDREILRDDFKKKLIKLNPELRGMVLSDRYLFKQMIIAVMQ